MKGYRIFQGLLSVLVVISCMLLIYECLSIYLPAAAADADEVLQQAEAYKTARINEATGQASRFEKLYEEYSKYPEITRQRLFYETVSDIFPGMKIIITGKDGSEMTTVLPLDEFMSSAKEGE